MKTVDKLLQARAWHKIHLHDLVRLKVSLKKMLLFIETTDHHPSARELESTDLRARFLPPPDQFELFAPAPVAPAPLTNEF